MPEETKESSIELLPQKSFEEYPLSQKIIAWMANVGRIVIILTELLAFSVFASRLKLDRDLTDLTDAIENRLVIVQNAKDLEKNVKVLQLKLKVIGELRDQQVPTAKVFTLLARTIPKDITLVGLTFEKDELFLIAKTPSATSFSQMVSAIREVNQVSNVQLTAGRFSAREAQYNFSLSLAINTDLLP